MHRMHGTARWLELLLSKGVSRPLAEILAHKARSNIRLVPSDPVAPDITPAGKTKLGGMPDLPHDIDWPVRPPYADITEATAKNWPEAFEPRPLEFLAQINLADVNRSGTDLPLPETGVLLFFYDSAVKPWGSKPSDGIGTRVIFAGEDLIRNHEPAKSSPARPLVLERHESLPCFDSVEDIANDRLGLSREALRGELYGCDEDLFAYSGHGLGGWPDVIQREMELECQLASNGLEYGTRESHEDPRKSDLEAGAHEWRLLLQLESDERQGWMWGDDGRLYFWCRALDIAARRFDRVWTILQCT